MACQPFESSHVAFEEWVLRSLKASSLIKPSLTPGGWREVKCVYWKVSVGLKRVHMSRIFFCILSIFIDLSYLQVELL